MRGAIEYTIAGDERNLLFAVVQDPGHSVTPLLRDGLFAQITTGNVTGRR